MRRSTHKAGSFALVLAVFSLVISSLMPVTTPNAAAQSDWAPPATVYIPETGHSLDRAFLDIWRAGGGAASYGNPITPEITLDNGHIVQYLQYARFEYWPEGDANGNTILLGKIGEELRPATIQRSMAGASLTGATADQLKAWLPVAADSEQATAENVQYVDATRHTIQGEFLDWWWATGDASFLGNPLTEEYTIGDDTFQVFERGQLRQNDTDGVVLMPVGKTLVEKYKLDTAPMAQGDLPTYDESLFVPPPEPTAVPSQEIVQTDANSDGVDDTTGAAIEEEAAPAVAAPTGQVWVDINLSSEYMTIYQGDTVLMGTYISSGKPGFETPPGSYTVNTMLDSQTMEGVLGGEYYNVPDVPYVMYFTGVGHAIHGAYWHNNFGTPMSHGCINMPLDAAAYLYSIAYIGMPVEIHW